MFPLCFVLLPSGKRSLSGGAVVDFDRLYLDLVEPAIRAEEMEPLRAQPAPVDTAARDAAFEHLLLSDFAVADLGGATPDDLYRLGVRQGLQPGSTVLLCAAGVALPPAGLALATASYQLRADGAPCNPVADCVALRRQLAAAKARRGKPVLNSPVFQLVERSGPQEVARLKTDVFRDRALYDSAARSRLAEARRLGRDAVRQVGRDLGDPRQLEAGVAIDLLLSYRAVSDWQGMEKLVATMAPPLAHSVMVREQLAFALNRQKRSGEAEELLIELIRERGPSSETCPLLGRIYKDRWDEAQSGGDAEAASAWLSKAIEAYFQGFEADWRDAFPGINAVTLMELQSPPDPRRIELLPIVTYAAKQRIAAGSPDYWDHATLIELAVLRQDKDAAQAALSAALTAVREKWEPETTARNLALIRRARETRGEQAAWATEIEENLSRAAGN